MEILLIGIIIIFILTYRNSTGGGVYKFITEQTKNMYDKYAPYSYKEMRKKIKALKDEIYMRKHKFSNLELAQIVIEFASTWKEMMDYLFKLKKEIKEAKVFEYISQYIEIEQKQYELLVANDSNYVYEVDMYPGSPGDKYLCPSYESVYITIGSYEKAYKEFIDTNLCWPSAIIYFPSSR